MSDLTIQQSADHVAGLIRRRLGVKGRGLAEVLRQTGHRLPRKVRTEALYLDTAAMQAQHPKLLVQIDEGRVAQAHDACVRFLTAFNRPARRRAMLMDIVTSIAFRLLTLFLLVLAVLHWRGFI